MTRSGIWLGIGLALATTAVSALTLALGAGCLQCLAIASLLLLGEGILLAVLAYRGPGIPRTRTWPPTAHDAYVYEQEW